MKQDLLDLNREEMNAFAAELGEKPFRGKQLFQWVSRGASSFDEMTDQELAVWYNDHIIYPDKVRLNLYYLDHYSFLKDFQMLVCTVFGKNMKYAGEVI